MKNLRRFSIGLLPAAMAVAVLCPPARGEDQAMMSLDRSMDKVIVQGSSLPSLQGRAIANLRLMAWKDGALDAVPFQIDEKDPKGDYVMSRPDGSVDRDADNGRLDDNDELVFMARDAGDRGDPANAAAWEEIQLIDPQTKDRGFAYLVAFDRDPPPLSAVSYMQYREKADYDEVVTPYYTLHFPKNNVFISDIMIHSPAGGNGRDFMDRIKMRSAVEMLGGVVKVDRTEEDFVTKVLGVIAGPVRVIRQTDTRLVILLSLKSPSVIVNGSFFPCCFEFPSMLSLPFRMDLVAHDAYLRQGWDLNRNALGLRFYSNLCPQGVVMDGSMSPEEKELAKNRETLHWAMGTGPTGTFLFFGVWDKTAPIKALLYYEDDLKKLEPPEEDPGVMGFAYRMEDVLEMGGDQYPFNIVNYVVPDFNGDVDRALRVFQHPLEVKVKG